MRCWTAPSVTRCYRGRIMSGLVLLPLLFSASVALSQPVRPSTESVTVTGTKSREVLQGFIQSFAAPTRMTGKIARWEDGICPVTVGLRPEFVKFINRRLKEIAAQVGAPVNDKASCGPNIAIVFTTTPQALVDNVRKKHPALLGYYDNSAQLDKLATVAHPVQAWYMTATKDVNGAVQIDGLRPAGLINEIELPCDICPAGKIILHPDHLVNTTGSRLGDGLRSDLYNVIVVADPTKLLNDEIGSLADYIAMLALTQLDSLDTCQQLPSIVNMLAKDCDRKTSAVTENDTAYLRGLYKMGPGRTLRTQRDEIAYQMERDLTAGQGPESNKR
jgi:hypothetical protein